MRKSNRLIVLSTLVLLAACGPSEKEKQKAEFVQFAATVNPIIKELQPHHASIMHLPEKMDLTTISKLALACEEASEASKKLSSVSSGGNKGVALLSRAAIDFQTTVAMQCGGGDGTPMSCWKACSSAWNKLDIIVSAFGEEARSLGVEITPLETEPKKSAGAAAAE